MKNVNELAKEKEKNRKAIIILSLLLMASAIFSCLFFIIIYAVSSSKYFNLKHPNKIEEPPPDKIINNLFEKKIFLTCPQIGIVTDIKFGEFDQSPGKEIAIAGTKGALFIDKNGNVKNSVQFREKENNINIIDVEHDGVCEFMNRGSWKVPASLIDHNGNTLWSYENDGGVDDMASGDINGDGLDEFVIGFNGDRGICALDKNGKKIWETNDMCTGNVWHVEIADTNRDGKPEILHSNAGGFLTIRDMKGKTVIPAKIMFYYKFSQELKKKDHIYFGFFSLCRLAEDSEIQKILLAEKDRTNIIDFNGNILYKLNAPESKNPISSFGLPVRLLPPYNKCFAVISYNVTGIRVSPKKYSLLYIYNESNALIYQEILNEPCKAITAVSFDDSGSESLLVCGDGKIIKYDIKHLSK